MLTAGTRLGPYEVVSAAGAGGMGEVYRARDSRLDRTVAIKLLPPHLAGRDDLRQRFQTEARAIARLQHANICAVFDVGEEGGVDYLVLEYLEGETLEKQLERGPLPISDVLRTGAQIAAGLDAAHRAGITHRDLKPANVMLTKSGAKLLDFGLAKVSQTTPPMGSATSVDTMTKALTVEGTIMGTFQYMAPEQLEGEEADARTDIFALGLVIYEMVTGRKAFQGKSQATLISSIMSSDPQPVSALQPATPPALERVILRCLAKDRDERWQTARDLCRELEWIALGGSQAGAPAPMPSSVAKRRPARLAWAVAAAGFLAAAVISWLYFHRTVPSGPVARFTVSFPAKLQFLAGPLLSPDGGTAALWFGNGADWQLYLYTLATGQIRPLPNSAKVTNLCWSPDGRNLAVRNPVSGEVSKIEVSTGSITALVKSSGSGGIAWNRAGVILYDNNDGALYRIAAEGGTPKKVLALTSPRTFLLQFLPDGDHFLMGVYADTTPEIRVASLAGGAPRLLLPAVSGAQYLLDRLLFLRANTLLAQPFDPGSAALSGGPVTIASNVDGNRVFTASESGVLMFHREIAVTSQELTWYDRSGKKLGSVGAPDQYTNPAISPDGKRLAVGVGDINAHKRDIWIYDLVRGGNYRLTFDPADDYNPVWSPDGRYVAFSSNRRGKRDLYRKLASGTGDDELLLASADDKSLESWSPDGRLLWFNLGDPKTRNDIYHFSLDDRKVTKYIATPFNEDKAQLSPDGRLLAYHSTESTRDEVYLQPYPATGERWQVSTAGGNDPQWRGDGKELFFISGNSIVGADIKTAGKNVEIGIPHPLFEAKLPPNSRNRFVPSRDGQKFLVVWQPESPQATGFETIMNWPELLKTK
jgi:eukaryotic-like serine/threonine-protein kinase